MITESYLILDIESYCKDGIPNIETDELRYIGFKYKDKKVMCHVEEHNKIQNIINFSEYLVGHGLKHYDIPILKRYGFTFPYKQVVIDTYEISFNRLKSMLYLDLSPGDMQLRNLLIRFNLPIRKGEFNYSLMKDVYLEGKNLLDLEEYLFADLDGTDELFKYYYEFFIGFKEYMSEENQHKMCWLINRSGSTAYKCLCNMAGLKEEYEDDIDEEDNKYDGGFVALPYKNSEEDDIYLFDFKSLYPHMMMGFNLYSQVKDGDFFRGTNIYPTIYGNEIDGIKGHYKTKELGTIEKVILSLFKKRQEVKNNLQQYLAIKILINTIYGILGSKKFKSVYNLISASDCTALARRSIKFARTLLEEFGYEILYTDTDSLFIKDPYKNYERLQHNIQLINVNEIAEFNIPIESHGLVLETEIKKIWFFKNDEGKYNKKYYIYVTKDLKLIVKGLKIKRGNCSKLAKLFFEQYMKTLFVNNLFIMYLPEDLLKELKQFAIGKEELLLKRYRVNTPDSYKINEGKEEASSLHYQIAKKYGPGEHYLLPNKRIGCGKGIRYAKLEELKEKYGDHYLDQILMEEYLKDLSEFIDYKQRNNLSKIDRKRIKYEDNSRRN